MTRFFEPPLPLIHNPREPDDFPLGRWNLYIGGAGRRVPGYVNLDVLRVPGVDVTADAEWMPFPPNLFQRIECDAVLEHVQHPERVMAEIERVLVPGGHAHLVRWWAGRLAADPDELDEDEEPSRPDPDHLRRLIETQVQPW